MKARLFPLTFVFVLAWALDVALPGLKAQEIDGDPGTGEVFLVATQTNVKRSPVLMIRLMPARRAGGPEVVRDFSLGAMKKSDVIKEGGVKTSNYGQIPVARYTQGIQLVPAVTL